VIGSYIAVLKACLSPDTNEPVIHLYPVMQSCITRSWFIHKKITVCLLTKLFISLASIHYVKSLIILALTLQIDASSITPMSQYKMLGLFLANVLILINMSCQNVELLTTILRTFTVKKNSWNKKHLLLWFMALLHLIYTIVIPWYMAYLIII